MVEHFKKGDLRLYLSSEKPLILIGEPGIGKTRLIETLAEECSQPLRTVSCAKGVSERDLVGRYILRTKLWSPTTVWEEGPLSKAARLGEWLYLDEIDQLDASVLAFLHPVADHRRRLITTTQEIGDMALHHNFRLVGSCNSTRAVPRAFLDRCRLLQIRPLSLEEESRLLEESGLPSTDCAWLKKISETLQESGYPRPSTRQMLSVAEAICCLGIDTPTAVVDCLLNALADGGGEELVGVLKLKGVWNDRSGDAVFGDDDMASMLRWRESPLPPSAKKTKASR